MKKLFTFILLSFFTTFCVKAQFKFLSENIGLDKNDPI